MAVPGRHVRTQRQLLASASDNTAGRSPGSARTTPEHYMHAARQGSLHGAHLKRQRSGRDYDRPADAASASSVAGSGSIAGSAEIILGPTLSIDRDVNDRTELSTEAGSVFYNRRDTVVVDIDPGTSADAGGAVAAGVSRSGRALHGCLGRGAGGAASARERLALECERLSALRHPKLMLFLGHSHRPSGDSGDRGAPCLITEYMACGTLKDLILNLSIELNLRMKLDLLRDCASGMLYLHLQRPPVVHRDLKPSNLLVDDRFTLKIADFGNFRSLSTSGPVAMALEYAAPELLLGAEPSSKSDVYAFGIVMWELFARREVYDGYTTSEILDGVRNLSLRPPTLTIPSELSNLMQECWLRNPDQRPDFSRIVAELEYLSSPGNHTETGLSLGALDRQQQLASQTDALVKRMLPQRVADALRSGLKVEPENYESVTIFFSDVVGFTTISAMLKPGEVMDMLHRLYTDFDNLTERHGLFKVETVGDAYMVVGSLPEPQEDHVVRVALFALDAVEASKMVPVKLTDPSLGCVRIRAGFHSGPVVASVVGDLNPRYCLFGDAVNTASRMESTSRDGRVQLSGDARVLLESQLKVAGMEGVVALKSRGEVLVKGKGKMRTYWLNRGERAPRHSLSLSRPADTDLVGQYGDGGGSDLYALTFNNGAALTVMVQPTSGVPVGGQSGQHTAPPPTPVTLTPTTSLHGSTPTPTPPDTPSKSPYHWGKLPGSPRRLGAAGAPTPVPGGTPRGPLAFPPPLGRPEGRRAPGTEGASTDTVSNSVISDEVKSLITPKGSRESMTPPTADALELAIAARDQGLGDLGLHPMSRRNSRERVSRGGSHETIKEGDNEGEPHPPFPPTPAAPAGAPSRKTLGSSEPGQSPSAPSPDSSRETFGSWEPVPESGESKGGGSGGTPGDSRPAAEQAAAAAETLQGYRPPLVVGRGSDTFGSYEVWPAGEGPARAGGQDQVELLGDSVGDTLGAARPASNGVRGGGGGEPVGVSLPGTATEDPQGSGTPGGGSSHESVGAGGPYGSIMIVSEDESSIGSALKASPPNGR